MALILCLSLLLTSCSGYNAIMRGHLGDTRTCLHLLTAKNDRLFVTLVETPQANMMYNAFFREE